MLLLLSLLDGQGNFRPVDPATSGLVVTGDATSLTATDLNNDGKVDFVVGRNNTNLLAFTNQTSQPSQAFRISELAGNEMPVGAKILLKSSNGSVRLHEVTAGSGYLSQSPNLIFGAAEINKVTWPKALTNFSN